jgi:tRNA A37 threonylcarbamoyladenosine dehydratase
MPAFLSRRPHDLRAAAAVAAGVVIGCSLACLALSGRDGGDVASTTPVGSAASSPQARPHTRGPIPARLLEEQFARNRAFFGDAGQDRVMSARVVIFGAADAGSHCAHMLVRSGVQRLVVVDDHVIGTAADASLRSRRSRRRIDTLSTNALARAEDVGRSCAEVLKRYCEAFSNADISTIDCGCDADDDDDAAFAAAVDKALGQAVLASDHPDVYVVDCLDGTTELRRKLRLLRACVVRGVRVVSLLTPARGRLDPTRVRAEPLGSVHGDPTALLLQKALLADFERRTRNGNAATVATAITTVTTGAATAPAPASSTDMTGAAATGESAPAATAAAVGADTDAAASSSSSSGRSAGSGASTGATPAPAEPRTSRGGRRSSDGGGNGGGDGSRGGGGRGERGGGGGGGSTPPDPVFGRIDAVTSSESWRGEEEESTSSSSGGRDDAVMACAFGMALASKCLCDLAASPVRARFLAHAPDCTHTHTRAHTQTNVGGVPEAGML